VVRENGHTYLVARVSSETLDSLATFETSRADLEEGGGDEPSPSGNSPLNIDAEQDTADDEPEPDLEPDHDNEPELRVGRTHLASPPCPPGSRPARYRCRGPGVSVARCPVAEGRNLLH